MKALKVLYLVKIELSSCLEQARLEKKSVVELYSYLEGEEECVPKAKASTGGRAIGRRLRNNERRVEIPLSNTK
jgi:hypothetical protein